jgi:hypothetical protein
MTTLALAAPANPAARLVALFRRPAPAPTAEDAEAERKAHLDLVADILTRDPASFGAEGDFQSLLLYRSGGY